MMAAQVELKLIGEKTLHHGANPLLLAYCPSMELLALGTSDQQVSLYRLNGQRVYSVALKGTSLTVDRISWKPNGQLLAVAWSDGIVRLIGAESSKTVHQIIIGSHGATGITCLGWVSNSTGKRSTELGPVKDGSSWQRLFEDTLDGTGDQDTLDLPRDLTLIDIESSLPKLSVLPAGSTSEDIFSSRSSLDGLFRASDPTDSNAVDVMVVGTKDGHIHLSIYDSFIVGLFPPPSSSTVADNIKAHMILHAAHRAYSTHALLMESNSSPLPGLYFIPMDLRFVSASSEYLSLLASRSTALDNLLRYINQVQVLMISEWQASQELPKKFLRNVSESLEEKHGCDIVQAMYHSVATGHTFPAMREWLVDDLAERVSREYKRPCEDSVTYLIAKGHKRWDKAVTTGLENLRKMVHEHMLPALERCALILSRLAGVVKYQGSNDNIGFSSHQVNLVMDTLACINLVSAKILTYVVEELELFAAFSAWLRQEIDRLASDSSASPPDDVLEKEATIDHSKVLLYIQTAMTTSRLSVFLQEDFVEEHDKYWVSGEQGSPMLERLDTQLRRQEEGLSYEEALPKIALLCRHMSRQAAAVFDRIAEAEKRNVLFGQPNILGNKRQNSPVAMKIYPQDAARFRVYIAMLPADQPGLLRIFSVQMEVENGISTQRSTVETAIKLGNVDIKDITFLNDHSLLVLHVSEEVRPTLLSIPYVVEDVVLSYRPSTVPKAMTNANLIDEILPHCQTYSFPKGMSFVPDKIEVSQRTKHRGHSDSVRLCVLDKNRLSYKVFTVPNSVCDPVTADDDVSMT